MSRALKYFEKTVDDEDLDYLQAGFSKLQSSNSKSKLKKFLTKDIFYSLRTRKTPTFGSTLKVRKIFLQARYESNGVGVQDVIQSGLENLDSGIGIYIQIYLCSAIDPPNNEVFMLPMLRPTLSLHLCLIPS